MYNCQYQVYVSLTRKLDWNRPPFPRRMSPLLRRIWTAVWTGHRVAWTPSKKGRNEVGLWRPPYTTWRRWRDSIAGRLNRVSASLTSISRPAPLRTRPSWPSPRAKKLSSSADVSHLDSFIPLVKTFLYTDMQFSLAFKLKFFVLLWRYNLNLNKYNQN